MQRTHRTRFDLSRLRRTTADGRRSRFQEALQARPFSPGGSFRAFLDGLPATLKARDLLALARQVVRARRLGKPVIVMLGGHVIKTGCAPLLIDLARQGFVSHVAANGAVAVHDTEMARQGQTSEDVLAALEAGTFGMAGDTADYINQAALTAWEQGCGFGGSLGRSLVKDDPGSAEKSILAACFRLDLPLTLHVALGTDIVHQHPSANGAAIGAASLFDFHLLAQQVSEIGQGGVVINLGSAVIMPEVFLKCLAMARNVSSSVREFTTANLDMLQHYRPGLNVLERPTSQGGAAYALTGHHEIMIPLLAAVIKEYAYAEK